MSVHILGINSAYHESAACIVRDGRVLASAAEERFNRTKHAKPARVDNSDQLPTQAIKYCLEEAGIELRDVDYFGYSFDPKKRYDCNVGVDVGKQLVRNSWGTEAGERLFYEKNLSVPKILGELAGIDISQRFHFLGHHPCHAASAFFACPFEESAILVVDGIAEFASTWLGYGRGNKIYPLLEVRYPHSLGLLWEKMSEFLGFTEYDACKVMGLSSYGDWRVMLPAMKQIITLKRDGTFIVDDSILQLRTEIFDPLQRVFQVKKRRKGDRILACHEHIAAALQKVTEDALVGLARRLSRETGMDNICLAGGVTLNCVANGKMIGRTKFENVFVQPAAYDSGTALGAAFYLWNQVLNKPRMRPLESVYLGPKYSRQQIRKTLKDNDVDYREVDGIERLAASLLAKGDIIGWFQGRLEEGPRALGHRSILGDPRSPDLRDILNRKVKYREPFRPLCPSVLEEDACQWFAIPRPQSPAYFMLSAYKVRRGKRRLIPAVAHVDGTSRIQLVSRKTDKKFYRLLKEFKKQTGVPVLLNTSFNIQEPIVCSPQDAINTFKRSKMDHLVIDNFIVNKRL